MSSQSSVTKDVLSGNITKVEFARLIKEKLPNFYAFSVERSLSLYDCIKLLHNCTRASYPTITDDISVDDPECLDFLHSLSLSIKANISNIESTFREI